MKVDITAIRIEMAKRCWTYKDLAEHSNLSYSTLISIMTGLRSGSIKTLGKVAKALQVDISVVLKDED